MRSQKFRREVANSPRPQEGRDDGDTADRRLRDALIRAISSMRDGEVDRDVSPEAQRAVRHAIRCFATSHRRREATPEATLIELKRTIAEVNPEFRDDRPTSERDAAHVFIDDAIRWCIEDYYRDE